MAAYFHGTVACNANTGNWLALPTLPAGMDPMRRLYFRADQIMEVGYGTAGQSAANLEVMCVGATGGAVNGGRAFGLLDYPRLVARSAGGVSGTLYVYSFAIGDEPM
jgi:hypothetical protein